MAELYVSQGHRDQAVEIYRRLARARPDDHSIARRLAELEGGGRAAGENMSFREQLQHIVDAVPGALSAMVMGFDGIAIDSYETASVAVDLSTLVIEYSGATQQLRQTVNHMPEVGNLSEVTVTRDSGTCLLRPLTEEYFFAVLLGPAALVGKARYLMRVAQPELIRDLS